MSALGQRALVSNLVDFDSIDLLAREGLAEECIPDDRLRGVVAFALDYYHQGGRRVAPTIGVLREHYGDLLDDVDIELGSAEETMEWALDDLRATYVHKEASSFNKRFATDMAAAEIGDRVQVISTAAADLVDLSLKMESHEFSVDMREAMNDRLAAYFQREAEASEHLVRGMAFGRGLERIDDWVGGIRPGEMAVVAAPAKAGKALSLDTPLLTSDGWTTMGEIRVGQTVYGKDGAPTKVVAATEVMVDHDCYRVSTRSGHTLVADAGHLWEVYNVEAQSTATPHRVVTTENLAYGYSGRRWLLPVSGAVQQPERDLPIDPWLFGYWLGDGCAHNGLLALHADDLTEIAERVVSAGWQVKSIKQESPYGYSLRVKGFITALRSLGVLDNKHIPEDYLGASIEQRTALLAGLCDADGYAITRPNGSGMVEFTSTNKALVEQVKFLSRSLGYKVSVREGVAQIDGRVIGPKYRIVFSASRSHSPVSFSRKVAALPVRSIAPRSGGDAIVSVEPVDSVPVRCIQVEREDGTYLAGPDLTVTHNSFMLARVALNEWERGRTACLYTLENSVEMTLDRMACMQTGISPQRWERGQCTDDEKRALEQFFRMLDASTSPLYVLQPDEGQRTPEAIVRSAQLRGGDSLIVDQLTWVEHPDPRGLSTREIIRDVLRTFRVMISTGRHQMPLLLAHQINREGMKSVDADGKLKMWHLAESSEVERAVDFAFGLYQGEAYREVNQTTFQMLAARRVDLKHWILRWNPTGDGIRVLQETVL